MKPRIPLLILIVSVLTIQGSLRAQEQPTFRDSVEVRVINLDVFVENADGKRVSGLSAEDFEILENGQPQPITNFAEYRAGEFVDPAPDPAAPLPHVRPAAERQPRTVVFVVDAFHQTPQVREKLFDQIRSFFREGLDTGDRAALFNWRRSLSNVVPLTTDLHEIDAALSKLGGLVLPPEESGLDQIQQFLEEAEAFRAASEGVSTSGPSSLQAQMETTIRNCAEEYLSEMETKTIALQSLISTLGGIEGRKLLVYVAGRFPADTGVYCQSIMRTPEMGPAALTFRAGSYNTDDLVSSVTEAANAAGVTFYPIRPNTIERRTTAVEYVQESTIGASTELGQSLVMMNDADALATLAEQTGGQLAVGDWMIDDLLPEIVSDLNNYYSLGYRATSDGRDRQRQISVRMKDRSLRARAREAFVEKSRLTEVKDQLIANLVASPLSGDIELEVVLGDLRTERRNRSILPIEVRIPLDQLIYAGPKPTAQVRLLSAAGTTPGAVTEISETAKRIEQPPAELPSPYITWKIDLAVPAGGTKVAFGVLDETSGLVGYATVDRTAEGLARAAEKELENLGRWDRTLLRNHLRGKPLLVYFRPDDCYKRQGFRKIPICDQFDTDVLGHPEIAQRLRSFELIRWTPDGRTADWPERRAGLMLARLDGTSFVTWSELPDGTNLARVLDTLGNHAAEIVRINELVRLERTEEANLATAMLQIRFGLRREATAILEQLASGSSTPRIAQLASARLAFLDSTRDRNRALSRLRALTTEATDAVAASEAWLAIAALATSDEEELAALQGALSIAPAGSSQRTAAQAGIERIHAPASESSIISIAPVAIASGRTELRTIVQSSRVDSVEFFLDGRSIAKDDRAPFRAVVDLARLPERYDLRVVARDQSGAALGESSTTLNGRSDAFWVRFTAPAGDTASGETAIELAVQVPSEEMIDHLEINGIGQPVIIDSPPWRATVVIDPREITILQATAVLSSGARAEDTLILNAPGLAETAGVHLVELPLVPIGDQKVEIADIRIMEQGEPREVEALLGADSIPITVGLIIDTSASMSGRILDVQSAAVGLIERVLGEQDRGFLVSFDSEARLEVGVTSDREKLVREVRSLTPAGSTALYDALMLGLLQFEPLGGRRAIVVFSDGDDRASRYKIEDVSEVARRAAVPIYLVRARIEDEQQPGLRAGNIQPRTQSSNVVFNRQQQLRLDHLTRETGGGFFELQSLDGLERAFNEIGRMMTRQILVTYLTETSRQEEWRPVEVRLEGKGSIRAPQGYYARPH